MPCNNGPIAWPEAAYDARIPCQQRFLRGPSTSLRPCAPETPMIEQFSRRCPGMRRRQRREFVRMKQRTLGHEQGFSRRPVMAHGSFAHALRSDPGSGAESRERDDVGMQRGRYATAVSSNAGTAEPKPTPMIGVSARLPAFHSNRSGAVQKIPSEPQPVRRRLFSLAATH